MLGLDPADRVNPQSQCRWRQGWSSLESLKKLEIIMRWTDRGKTRERMEEEGGMEGEEVVVHHDQHDQDHHRGLPMGGPVAEGGGPIAGRPRCAVSCPFCPLPPSRACRFTLPGT